MKQELMIGSRISWTIFKSFASRSRQITTPAPHHSNFYRPDALPDAEPKGTEGSYCWWNEQHVYFIF